MRDYEELVRELRGPVHSLDCEFCNRKCCYPDGVSDDKCVIIQAADAIEELQAYADLYKELTEKGQTVARKLIDAYPKWISVEERLPELYDDVLVYYERDAWPYGANVPIRKRETGVGFCGEPDRWHVDGCSKVKGIAWMPLPEPPKEERE